MKGKEAIIHVVVACLILVGCQTSSPPSPPLPLPPPPKPAPAPEVTKPQPEPVKKILRHQIKNRTSEQIQMLSNFAMKESPKIWQTIQTLRGQIAESGTKIKQLRADLLEFDRNPDTDDDYNSLVEGLAELKYAYGSIFDKLEDAYIAAKKYEASPSRKDYQDTMRRALEDGIQDANIATERYKAMMRQK